MAAGGYDDGSDTSSNDGAMAALGVSQVPTIVLKNNCLVQQGSGNMDDYL